MLFILCIIFGIICAVIASGKGRSPVGWFFIGFLLGLIGLIICLCMSNVKEEESRQLALAQENRRLREQIRQEQIKADTFRLHAQRRLDAHDQKLGLDTRADDRLLEGGNPVTGLLQGGDPMQQIASANAANSAASVNPQTAAAQPDWYYSIDGQTYGPIAPLSMAEMLRAGALPKTALFWANGMWNWATYDNVPELHALVNT